MHTFVLTEEGLIFERELGIFTRRGESSLSTAFSLIKVN